MSTENTSKGAAKSTPAKTATSAPAAATAAKPSASESLIGEANKEKPDASTTAAKSTDTTATPANIPTQGNGPGLANGISGVDNIVATPTPTTTPAAEVNVDKQTANKLQETDDDDDEEENRSPFDIEAREEEMLDKLADRIADRIIARQNAAAFGTGLTSPLATGFVNEEASEEELIAEYGKDYVRAQLSDNPGATRIFSKRTWDLLGDDKAGYKKIVKVPKEVSELKNKAH
jgi:hypothetical protein